METEKIDNVMGGGESIDPAQTESAATVAVADDVAVPD